MAGGRRSGRHHKMPVRFGLTAIDQCLSSLSNFAVGVGVARVAGVGGFGAYSLAYAAWLVVAAMHRSLITDPMSIENDVHQPDAATHVRRGLAAELTLGLWSATVFAAIGAGLLALHQHEFGICFIGLAPWLPFLLAQDYWRWVSFMRSQPQKALANDGVFDVVQLAAFAGLFVAGLHSALLAVFAWGIGAFVGALYGLWQFSSRPSLRGGFTRIRERWPLSRWIVTVNAMSQATTQATPVLTGAFLGPVGIGGLKAATSLVSGPSLVLIQAGGSIGLPEATKALKNRGWPGLRRVQRIVTAAGLLSVGVVAIAIFAFGQTLLVHIYGKAFGQYATVADILAVSVLVATGGLGAILSLKATRKAQRMVPVSAVSLVVSIVATVVLAQRYGITGAAVASLVGTATMTLGLLVAHWITSKRAAEALSAGGSLDAAAPGPAAPDQDRTRALDQDQEDTPELLGTVAGGRIVPAITSRTTARLPTRPFVPVLDLSIPARPTGGTAPMKILVVHNRYRSSSPSGEDRVVDQEHVALVDAGHVVRRFELFSDDIATFSPARKALVPAEVVWNPKSARDIAPVLEEFRPDVVHVHNLFPLLSPAVLTACQRHGIPSVVTLHNYRLICPAGTLFRDGAACRDCVGLKVPLPGVRHGCYRGSAAATIPIATATAAQRPIWRTAPSAYVFLSDAQRREMESMELPLDRCFVKPNLVLPVPARDEAEPLVVYTGRFTEAKGVRVLMQAWDRLLERRPTTALRLAFAGSGPLEETLRSWARSRPSVDVVGLLDREACTALVRRARAAVVPSEWPEPFGLVVPEAMAAGVAPIATAHGSFVDMIADGVDGLLYPPGDANALARIFEVAEDDPTSLDQLGQEARRTYERRFHPAKNVGELETIYRFAIDHPRRGDGARRTGWRRRSSGASTTTTSAATASSPPGATPSRPAWR
jgi:glycosyltransferase involved in cell wall biosynthesis/O-antigen/teichoic acid export membrane protein